MRRLLSKRKVVCFVITHFVILFLAAHYIATYRQPVMDLVLMFSARYWVFQFFGVVAMSILAIYIWSVSLYLWEYVKDQGIWKYIVVQIVLGLAIPVYVASKLVRLMFHLIKVDIEHSGYLHNEFLAIRFFIVAYNLLVVIHIVKREYKKLRIRHASLIRMYVNESGLHKQKEMDDFLEDAFMILITKRIRCKVKYSSDVEILSLDEDLLDRFLEFGYVRINRWMYVKKDSIRFMDPKTGKLYFKEEEQRSYDFIPKNKGLLLEFLEKIKSEDGTLYVSGTYRDKVESEINIE